MSLNFLEELQNQVSMDVTREVGNAIGENQSAVQKGMDTMLPSIVGGMMSRVSTNEGASVIFEMIQNTDAETNIANKVSDWNQNSVLGEIVLDNIFGKNISGVVNAISTECGIDKQSVSSMMKIAAPMVLSVIGSKVKNNGMDKSNFTSEMMGQSTFINNKLPEGIRSALASNVFETPSMARDRSGEETPSNTMQSSSSQKEEGRSFFGKFFPVIVAVAVCIFAWNYFDLANPFASFFGSTETVVEEGTEVMEATGSEEVTGEEAVTTSVEPSMVSFTLPDGGTMEFNEGSFGSNVAGFLGSGSNDPSQVFTMNNVTFDNETRTITEDSHDQLNNLAALLNAYPDVNVQVNCHTRAVDGDTDNALMASQTMAESVKEYLVTAGGIQDVRIETIGVGNELFTETQEGTDEINSDNIVELIITQK